MDIFKKGTQPHTKLTKTVVSVQKMTPNASPSAKQNTNGKDVEAMLQNANRSGAGFRTSTRIPLHNPVTVTMAFSHRDGKKGQETMAGKVAWVRDDQSKGKKGFLFGVAWDDIPTKATNPWLYDYLDFTLRSY